MTATENKIGALGTDASKSTSPTNLCHRCLRVTPSTNFRVVNRSTGRRARYCNQCHCAAEKARRKAKLNQHRRTRLHASWGILSRAQDRRLAVEKFVLELMRLHNGPEGFATDWHQAFAEATASKRLRAAESLCFLLEQFAKNPECLNVQRIDDLEAEQQRLAKQIIREQLLENADSVAEIASELGYRLLPARA